MKLAEALLTRAELTRKVESLKQRVLSAARVQEGAPPVEDATTLMAQAFTAIESIRDLEVKINRSNMVAAFESGATCMEQLASRDALRAKRNLLAELAAAASPGRNGYYSNREIRWLPGADVAATQNRIDSIAAQIHRLNTRIQEHNWAMTIE